MSNNNYVIRKGHFPSTIPEEELMYSFVSIDCDFYQPILDGLRYFYPRLNGGGYIMLHDYNQTKWLRGVKKAVSDYEKEIGSIIRKVPITDNVGSLVICK